jgi:hypothetical protein
MNIRKEDVLTLYFVQNRRLEEIARLYGMSPHKFSKELAARGITLDRTKSCASCGPGKNNFPSENSGGMTFELTKD